MNQINYLNSEIKIRLLMTELGWNSNDNLTDLGWGGGYGYSIWFERMDWHSVKIFSTVSFHKHSNDLDNIIQTTKDAALLALKAWNEYQDSVPTQLIHDKLGINTLATKTFNENK